jgi:D-sedoheptulose 7-phosphate isomerase
MAIANDDDYSKIFVEQLKNFELKDTLVIGLSGSGNSKNVIAGVLWAKEQGAITIGITGYDGGKLKGIVDHQVHVPINNMQIVEDAHMFLDHLAMSVLMGTI